MAILDQSIFRCLKLTIVPLLLLICFSLTNKIYAQNSHNKVRKVVIDAGHGGKDPGACGRIYYEKDIVLSVALRLGRLIEEKLPDVEIIYTRNRDYFVELRDRSDIANKAGADLFISIHANANVNRDVVGTETFVMGNHVSQENLNVAMRENAVIKYEDDYTEKYEGFDPSSPESYIIFSLMQFSYLERSIKMAELVQNELKQGPILTDRGVKQAGFWVLAKTAAPSILVEIGFISNIKEEEKLGEPETQQTIAESLFKAFKKYKGSVEGEIIVDDVNGNTDKAETSPAAINNNIADNDDKAGIKTEEIKSDNTPVVTLPKPDKVNDEKVEEKITTVIPEVRQEEFAEEVKTTLPSGKKTKEVKYYEYLYDEKTGAITKIEKVKIVEEEQPASPPPVMNERQEENEYEEYYGKTIIEY